MCSVQDVMRDGVRYVQSAGVICDVFSPRPAVLSLEEVCSVSSQTCHVAFLKSGYEGSPVDVQGMQSCSLMLPA